VVSSELLTGTEGLLTECDAYFSWHSSGMCGNYFYIRLHTYITPCMSLYFIWTFSSVLSISNYSQHNAQVHKIHKMLMFFLPLYVAPTLAVFRGIVVYIKKVTEVLYIIDSFIHLVVCLTTGPKPLPKRALHIVRSRASSFKWEYPLLSLRSSNSFLRLLPCLPVTSIPPCIFPSVTRCRR